jgi:hypothetical protein
VRIERTEEWSAWVSPAGVRNINDDGTVTPRFLRRSLNAALNATDFTYVISQGDTLQGGVTATVPSAEPTLPAHAADGDIDTFWEPERGTDIEDWGLQLDLGRTLTVERIRLRFVDETLGDPFLKFRVMVSDGLFFGEGTEQRRRFSRVGLMTRPNKDQREFTFELQPQRQVDTGVTGAIVQIINIDILDSDGPRAAEVSPEAYAALDSLDRGAVDYFRRTLSGRLILVTEDTHQALPPEEQGPVRHYRHERPRLAEIEVIAQGENIVGLTQRDRQRGLNQNSSDFILFRVFTDGLYATQLDMRVYDPFTDRNQVRIDLGAKYWLDRIKLLSPADPPPAYQMRISDGSINPSGDFVWTTFDEKRNQAGYQHVEERFRQQEVRHIEVRRLEFSGQSGEQGNLSEIQAYGEGFVSEVELTSPFMRLGRPRMFSSVVWEGSEPPNTTIEVRTRTGDEIQEVPHYFGLNKREISRVQWERIPESLRPPEVIEEVAGPDWSPWSETYQASGAAFSSPNPRTFVQTQVRLLSREPLRSAALDALELRFGAPLVDKVLAEIWPIDEVPPGSEEDFTLYLRPLFGSGNPGFDRIRLSSSASVPFTALEVRSGTDAQLLQGRGRQLWPGAAQVETDSAGALDITLPQPVLDGSQVIAVTFRTKVFLQSTQFSAALSRITRPGLVQLASSGDATALVASQSLVAVSDLRNTPLIADLQLSPAVFTPNGDGINDRTAILLTVFHLEGSKTLEAAIYDLAGRKRRDLSAPRSNPGGEHRLEWDGRDDNGTLLPPGNYIVRIFLDTDDFDRRAEVLGLIGLVY